MGLPFEVEHKLAWIVAGCFAALSGFITAYQIYNHLKYNSHPELRRFVIRIILMVPIYALESWLGLRFAGIALYFDLLRECYEAFVIYSFYQLLVTYLGGERELVKLLAKKPEKPHVVPFCWLPYWRMSDRFQIQFSEEEMERLQAAMDARQRTARPAAETVQAESKERVEDVESGRSSVTTVAASTTIPTNITVAGANPSPDFSAAASSPDLLREAGSVPERPTFSQRAPRIPPSYLSPYSRPYHSDFLTHTQLGTLQYCIAKPVTALLAFILSLLDLYGDSSLDWSRGYPYISFVTNMSQIWAMYTLVLFYLVCKEDLVGLRPVPKFLCVKAVVFFTFWQGVLIAILAALGILHETEHYTKEEVVVALQDFIVCIEMLVAALAHHYAFSWKDFHDPILHRTRPETQMLPALIEALNISDVYVQDVRRITTKSLQKKSKDNRMLTREEMHEMQYASFVAASGELNAHGAFEDLAEPLNPSADDSSTAGDSSGSYVSPPLVRPSAVSSASGHRHDSALQVERLHEVHTRKDRLDDGSTSITTVTRDSLRVSPVPPQILIEAAHAPSASVTFEPLDDGLAAPAESDGAATGSASEHAQPIVDEPSSNEPSASAASSKSKKHRNKKR